MKRKIIIDTDPGVDDAMALMLAIKSEQFDLQAITTVCGNAAIEDVTRNARYVLELLGRSDIPLYSGAEQPLARPLERSVVHGERGLGRIHPTNSPSLSGNAVDKIIELVETNHANQQDTTLVALGPLTNVAHAIQKNPKVMSRVQELVIMGGAIYAPGNKNRVAEFNFYVDPEAAEIVFRFPVAKSMVPLDACNKIHFTLADFRAVTNLPLRDALVEMTEPYIQSIAIGEGIDAALMYDPLTIYFLINPGACQTYRCHIAVETEGILTRGMSVADRRINPEFEANTTVVDTVEEKAFRSYFMETISIATAATLGHSTT